MRLNQFNQLLTNWVRNSALRKYKQNTFLVENINPANRQELKKSLFLVKYTKEQIIKQRWGKI